MNAPFKDGLEKRTQRCPYLAGILTTVTGDGTVTFWEDRTFPEPLEPFQASTNIPKQHQPFVSLKFSHLSDLECPTELNLQTSTGRKTVVYFLLSENRIRLINVSFRNHTRCILIYTCFVWFLTRFAFRWPNCSYNWLRKAFQTSLPLLSFLFLLMGLKLIRVN